MTCFQKLQRQILCCLVHGKMITQQPQVRKAALVLLEGMEPAEESRVGQRVLCLVEGGATQQITLTDARQRGRRSGMKSSQGKPNEDRC